LSGCAMLFALFFAPGDCGLVQRCHRQYQASAWFV